MNDLGVLRVAAALALGGLVRNGLRATLTAVGILIGVAAVTIVVALGEGASRAVTGSIDSLGENALMVTPRARARSGMQSRADRADLAVDDARALAAEASGVRAAAPMVSSWAQVMWSDGNTTAEIVGTSGEFFEIRNWRVTSGQVWSPAAEKTGEKVCLIGTTVRDELMGGGDPVGQLVRIGRHPYRVIGLLESKGQSPFGADQDNTVVMPLLTLAARVTRRSPNSVDRILLGAESADASSRVEREARTILRQRHGLAEGIEDDFRISSQEEFKAAQEQILSVLRTLLLGIAAVSLVVGGVGVMNVMLVSVAERTREIGIRMAIGAREVDIMAQFLLEAIWLSLAGGSAGAALAAVVIHFIGRALGWEMALSVPALATALTTSTVVGIGFGFLPARRAARLDPIDALGRG